MADEKDAQNTEPISPEIVTELPTPARPPSPPMARFFWRLVVPTAVGWWLLSSGMERLLPDTPGVGLAAVWLALFVGLVTGVDLLGAIAPGAPIVAFVIWLLLGIGGGSIYMLYPWRRAAGCQHALRTGEVSCRSSRGDLHT